MSACCRRTRSWKCRSPTGALVDQRDAERTRLRHEGDVAGHRFDGGEDRVHPHRGVGVGHAHAVRSDHAHAISPGRLDQAGLDGAAVGPQFGESGADDDEASDVGGTHSSITAATAAAGTAMIARSTGTGMSPTSMMRHLRNSATGRVDLRRLAKALGLGEHDESQPHRHGPGPEGHHGEGSLEHLMLALASGSTVLAAPLASPVEQALLLVSRPLTRVPPLDFLSAQRAQAPPA